MKTLFYLGNKLIAQLTKTFYPSSTESLFLRLRKFSSFQERCHVR